MVHVTGFRGSRKVKSAFLSPGQLDITDLSNDLSDLETEVNTLRDDCNTKISNIQADVELGINTTVESIQQQFDGKLAALVSQMAANISLVQSILMENCKNIYITAID